MNKTKKRGDLILVAAVLIIAVISFAAISLMNRKPALYVEITVNGEVVETLDLNKDTVITISGYGYGENTLLIENGTVRCTYATCPDKVCIDMGVISQSGQMIVCLPNRMIATVKGGDTD